MHSNMTKPSEERNNYQKGPFQEPPLRTQFWELDVRWHAVVRSEVDRLGVPQVREVEFVESSLVRVSYVTVLEAEMRQFLGKKSWESWKYQIREREWEWFTVLTSHTPLSPILRTWSAEGMCKPLTRSNWPSIGSGCTVWCFLFWPASLIT